MANHDKYQNQIDERKKYTDLILNSLAVHKIVVAGAGTGKSFIFKSLLTLKDGKCLALTFINNLAGDLTKELSGVADVYTFHGFCKSLLHKVTVDGIDKNFNYFPLLPQLIVSDALILASHLTKFDEAIQRLEEDERIEFYLQRADFYNAVGHNDAVYRVLKYFIDNPGLTPKFSQIVVDEFQDFNKLEVEFIEQLSAKNPILIAGDDDQALYGFKQASPLYIRQKALDEEYELFELPYCSRCTQVIITSVLNITSKAKELGLLRNRIDKKYLCFLPEKEEDSANYPTIIHATCSIQNKADSRNYIGKYIESEIKKISREDINLARDKNYPCVLILGQSQYLKQVYEYLKNRYTNVDYKERDEEVIEVFDGYRLLMSDESSNLGWRIILEFEAEDFKKRILNSSQTTGSRIIEKLDPDFVKKHLEIARIIIKIIKEDHITENEIASLKTGLNLNLIEARAKFVKTENIEKVTQNQSPTIKLTTINGSKGMSGGFVFVLNMNDNDFPKNPKKPTDHEICQLIVALTRTRKQCYLISNGRFGLKYGIQQSSFINWLGKDNVTSVVVNSTYIRSLEASTADEEDLRS